VALPRKPIAESVLETSTENVYWDRFNMHDVYWFVLLGLLAGFSAGLLGIGGGSITVPLLFFILRSKNLPTTDLMQIVIGTTFAAMCLNSLVSMITHHVLRNIRWKMFLPMLPALIIGPIVGSLIATHLSGDILRYAFGIFQCLMALYFILPIKIEEDPDHYPSPLVLNLACFLIGTVGSILGIGGGILLVPFLAFLRVPLKKAIGTSSAATFVMISLSAVCYFLLGMNENIGGKGEVGFIYIPAFLAIGLSSVAGAPVGAYLVQFLPTQPLKKIFAIAQAALGIILITQS
jgi:uncharacterized protein